MMIFLNLFKNVTSDPRQAPSVPAISFRRKNNYFSLLLWIYNTETAPRIINIPASTIA